MSVEYVRTETLAARTGLTKRFWEKLRLRGGGPPYSKAGSACLYNWEGVVAWLKNNERTSTSDTQVA